jgi:hypothetical protein
MEASFISDKFKIWVKNTVLYCLQNIVTDIVYVSCNCLSQLLEPALFYVSIDVSMSQVAQSV